VASLVAGSRSSRASIFQSLSSTEQATACAKCLSLVLTCCGLSPARCTLIFEGKKLHPPTIAAKAGLEFNSLLVPIAKPAPVVGGIPSWSPPSREELKINVDGALSPSKATIGLIIRNYRGIPIKILSQSMPGNSPLIIETMGIHVAIQEALSVKGKVVIESDAQVVVAAINGLSAPPWRILSIVEDCQKLIKGSFISVSFAPRSCNRAAHVVAKLGLYGPEFLRWDLHNVPASLSSGVVCELGRVTQLCLPSVGLMGTILAGVLGNLTELRTLSLRFNALSGTLPPDLASLVQLRNLYLQDNSFSGQIPASIFALQNLLRLNLGRNRFSGGISSEFGNLKRLRTLYLDRNQLSG
ncbi:hypothetical protein Taro_047007, partial [Colocasia esculenta]|nr:hypothetical protein [Colocasia esculenta]